MFGFIFLDLLINVMGLMSLKTISEMMMSMGLDSMYDKASQALSVI